METSEVSVSVWLSEVKDGSRLGANLFIFLWKPHVIRPMCGGVHMSILSRRVRLVLRERHSTWKSYKQERWEKEKVAKSEQVLM